MLRVSVLAPAIFVTFAFGSAVAQEAALVGTARVETRQVVETLRLTGTVTAPLTSDVSTDIASRVLRTEVELAERVSAGDPLVTLDSTLERLELDAAQAVAAAAEAELANVERQLRNAEQLVADSTLPRNELESRQAEASVARAELTAAEAEAARLIERIERHTIRAPFAGAVTARLVEAGEWVEPGTAVVQLVATDRLFVDVPVPEQYFPRVGPDTDAVLEIRALGREDVPAAIAAKVPMTDPVARTFLLRLEPGEKDLPLAAGMAAQARLTLPTGRDAVVVPRDALIRYPDGRTTVWTVEHGADGATARERHVALGGPAEGGVYVFDGIAAGAEVVTRGNEALSPGQRIRTGTGS